jgi:hypothetical protein
MAPKSEEESASEYMARLRRKQLGIKETYHGVGTRASQDSPQKSRRHKTRAKGQLIRNRQLTDNNESIKTRVEVEPALYDEFYEKSMREGGEFLKKLFQSYGRMGGRGKEYIEDLNRRMMAEDVLGRIYKG